MPKEDWSREVCEAMEREKESWDWCQVDEEVKEGEAEARSL